MRRTALAAVVAALMAAGADAALAHSGPTSHLPDAEIFATNNTRVITDPADPQLHDPLVGFGREVERIVERGGGKPRGSQLLDGIFFSSDLGATTFERSREFDVDGVTPGELHDIADGVRRRFGQESVLTFDFPEHPAIRSTPSRSRCPASARSSCATACSPIARRPSDSSAAR
jgi:hypothetical protein